MWHHMFDGTPFWGMHLMWWIFWLILIILIIVIIRRFLSLERSKGETSIEILKKRYARGEIDKAEYEEKKKDLKEN